ncbi:MAG: DNA-3-methyladenine glycosylase I [Chitinivibrionales bacterium]|nr:DNA-3-methyladenine glycosylase I [Chitinivibrionales bacterium]
MAKTPSPREPASKGPHKALPRCEWAGDDPLYIAYHDDEWGEPLHDDRRLFELLILEGFQAGLSWITILRKRAAFRSAFHQFDWERIARYTDRDVERLLANKAIVRNRLKIAAAITNARRFIELRDQFGSFDSYIWQFTGHETLRPSTRVRTFKELPTHSAESDAMSRDLRSRGFSFVGTTICYAYMQAIGMVDDHLAGCWKALRNDERT